MCKIAIERRNHIHSVFSRIRARINFVNFNEFFSAYFRLDSVDERITFRNNSLEGNFLRYVSIIAPSLVFRRQFYGVSSNVYATTRLVKWAVKRDRKSV